MAEGMTKLWYIQNFDPFRHMDEAAYRLIDKHSAMRSIRKGDVLYLQGSADKNIYMLKEGAVKITKLNPHGKEIILDIFGKGSIFGEMAHIEPEMRDESAVAIEDGLVCTMEKQFFDRAMLMMPELSTRVTKIIGLRRWKVENKLLTLLYSTIEQRLARTLLTLASEFGEERDGGRLIRLKLTHRDYAELIASTRETVTAELGRFRGAGLIEFDGKYVVVREEGRLKELAQ